MSTSSAMGGLGNIAEDLGSLAQSARAKQLKTARGILLFVGIMTVAFNVGFVFFAESVVDSQIETELREIRAQHLEVDQEKLAELRQQAIRSTQLVNGIGVIIGIVFLACALAVYRYPVASTVTSLVLYLGAAAVYGVLDPTTLARGWWVKILIVIGLFKAVQAALAFESDRKRTQELVPGELAQPSL